MATESLFSKICYADACRDVGFLWNEEFITSFMDKSNNIKQYFYFKSIGVSDTFGVPYMVFYSDNGLINIPKGYVEVNGEKYQIISNVGEVCDKLPNVEEGVDYKIQLKNVTTGEIVPRRDNKRLLKNGLFKIEWVNDRFVIDVTRLNLIVIGEKK